MYIQSLETFTGIKLSLSNFFRCDFYNPLYMMDCRSFWLPFSRLVTTRPQVEQDPEACLQFLCEVPAKTSTDQDNSSSRIFGKSIFAKLKTLPITQFFSVQTIPIPAGSWSDHNPLPRVSGLRRTAPNDSLLPAHWGPAVRCSDHNPKTGCVAWWTSWVVKPTAQPQRFLNPPFLLQTMYIFKYFFLKCCLLHVFYPPNSSSEIAQEISFRQAHGSFPMKSLLLWQFLTLDEFLPGGPFIILQNDPALWHRLRKIWFFHLSKIVYLYLMKKMEFIRKPLSPELSTVSDKHIHGVDKFYRMFAGLSSYLLSYENEIIELEIRFSKRWPKPAK